MRYKITFSGRHSEIIKARDDEEAIQIAEAIAFDSGLYVEVKTIQRLPYRNLPRRNEDDYKYQYC